MSGKPGASRVKKVMVQAMNLMFKYLKGRDRVLIWLYENTSMKIEGVIVGFDEYMNIVLDDAYEVYIKTGNRRSLGRIMLKGDCVTLIQQAQPEMEMDST